jgi:UPF0755 protein
MNEPSTATEDFIGTKLEPEKLDKLPKTKKWRHWLVITGILFLSSTTAYSWYLFLQTPPANFPLNESINIEFGTGTRDIITLLKDKNLIRSEIVMYLEMLFNHPDSLIKASTHKFTEPLDVKKLALKLIAGDPSHNLIKLTLIEGESVAAIAKRADASLENFNVAEFLALSKPEEGKLLPETYLIPKNYSASELFSLLSNTFKTSLAKYDEVILSHDLTENEIIILASIIEREANTSESMKLVSGILQNRLKINMALQVDASMEYVLDKPLSALTPDDLQIDSPYNTYLYPGLPPTPIGNPGLEAIEAVLYPEPSNYLFYITGNDGQFYYAKNFDEHRINIARYLR